MPVHVDYLVLGLGGMGSSALYHLARRGLKVLGVEQFGIAHDRGSSHGETRIIRKAYFEHPDYIPLLQRAYSLWEDLEQESGKSLLNLCGLMVAGPPEGDVIKGVHLAEERHGVQVETLEMAEAQRRFPGFQLPEGFEVTFEPEAGFLHVEDCVQAHMDCALNHGAQIVLHEPIESLLVTETEIEIQTANQHWVAEGVIVTAGAWAGECLKELQLPLEVARKVLFWNPVQSPVYNLDQGGCGFLCQMPFGEFYGFPSLDGKTVKLAEHTGGDLVTDPNNVNRELQESDSTSIGRFVDEVMSGLSPESERHAVCMYTRSVDRHFIIDQHPRNQRLVYGAGFSGHGFKFASVMGEILADLVTEGKTNHPIDFLRADRFQGAGN